MIRTYEDGDLSSGWIGTRVAVSVNNKLRQKYYGRTNVSASTAIELATIQETKWLADQLQYAKSNIYSNHSNTKLSALQFTYDVTRRVDRTYIYHKLSYHSYFRGNTIQRSWFFKDNEVSRDVWFDVCNTIRNFRGLTNTHFDKMMALHPTPKHIDAVYSKMLGKLNDRNATKAEHELIKHKTYTLIAKYAH